MGATSEVLHTTRFLTQSVLLLSNNLLINTFGYEYREEGALLTHDVLIQDCVRLLQVLIVSSLTQSAVGIKKKGELMRSCALHLTGGEGLLVKLEYWAFRNKTLCSYS